ncbi:cyclic GMP-AMP synthase DncV-like nucleotidyltransferase [Elizabethkingia anophelis]|uniref:Cyclic GMP-AMP synthase n=1 Tax=Elizabethkingia anophelis TaxID=1117645 RepID=A0AAU8VFD1_9FLAO|nr:hypothetical protein [Elizabethkingia anophelis]AQX01471.1 hypothetical protein BBD32_08355 [Elizabethkingia anophelis]OPB62032.1 hypothetical protein BAY11_17005 [Elizabethkingia anophelis]
MANCNNLFKDFNKSISISADKKSKMTNSKEKLRDRIRKWFKDNHPDYEPKFYIQGSYKMRTAIRTKDDICDLDDGVYFFKEPDVTATTLQKWVHQAVNGYTNTPSEHRKKCIRTIFTSDYEIDHPVYYKIESEDYQIAVKDSGFEGSDPKAVVEWFNKNKDNNGYLISMVKYLKAWCDHLRNKMPSGLAMTILAVKAKNNIVLNQRDDITLKDILKEIRNILNIRFECIVPAVPYDDLFENYDETRKNNFLNSLNNFIEDAEEALREENELKSSKLWRKHLGERFPEGKNQDQNKSNKAAAAAVGAATSFPWAK